ncbi:MAG TPA: hypothetical protein VHL34_11915 [Rhizomicrobium sp.]|nr:hypothetical protein [Rhizomicrobium sp.]
MSRYYTDALAVPLSADRPLLILDADEVILKFVDGFDRFLRARDLFIDLTSYRLHGNVKRLDDRSPVLDVEVTALLDEFRADLDSLLMVEGAREVLNAFSPVMQIVVLSNVVPAQAEARLRNFAAHGFDFPLVTNSGSKGDAVRKLASRGGSPAFFVDDIPQHLASAAKYAPEVYRIHMIGDERLKPLLPAAEDAHLRADTWDDVEAFIRSKL